MLLRCLKELLLSQLGFPPLNMYIDALPLVIIGYILLFGDIITGKAILGDAEKERPDEPLDVDVNKVHLSIAIRNFLGLIANPNFPTQGALWTGVHVVVAERWRKGPKEMPSIFDGLGSYYLMAIPPLVCNITFCNSYATLDEHSPKPNIGTNRVCVRLCSACYS